MGIAAAHAVLFFKQRIAIGWVWLGLVLGLFGIIWSASAPVSIPNLNGYRVLFFGIPAALLVWSLTHLELANRLHLNWKTGVLVGNASYALYLIHSPLVSAGYRFKPTFFDPQIWTLSVAIAIVLLAVVLHKKVEWPLYRKFLQSN
jgi:peptidoglycan/LPS O-acetylase OafA/YrhL